jgi:hypothetical protein
VPDQDAPVEHERVEEPERERAERVAAIPLGRERGRAAEPRWVDADQAPTGGERPGERLSPTAGVGCEPRPEERRRRLRVAPLVDEDGSAVDDELSLAARRQPILRAPT